MRVLELFGRSFELCLIPDRAARKGVPSDTRPSFGSHPGFRIRREEAFWTGKGLVATPNRYPFFGPSFLLWPESGTPREVTRDFLQTVFEVQRELDAVVVCNTIGAAASIPLAHAHVLLGPRPMLDPGGPGSDREGTECWPLRPLDFDASVDVCESVRIQTTDLHASWPLFAAVVEAPCVSTRADWVRALLDTRSRAAVTILATTERVFLIPRRREGGAPAFPFAIGGGELSGRFIFADRSSYENASASGLERALRDACVECTSAEVDALREVCSARSWRP